MQGLEQLVPLSPVHPSPAGAGGPPRAARGERAVSPPASHRCLTSIPLVGQGLGGDGALSSGLAGSENSFLQVNKYLRLRLASGLGFFFLFYFYFFFLLSKLLLVATSAGS